MISQQAIKDFLNKKFENWSWIKDISKEDLKKSLFELYPDYKYKKYEPLKHQISMNILGILNPNFLFFADMGTGKTRVILDLIQYYKSINKFKSALIISPNITSVEGWGEEIDKHTDLTHTELTDTIINRLELLQNTNTDIYNINYKGLQLLLTSKVKEKNDKKNKLKIDNKEILKFISKFNFLVIDESHKCKNSKSLNYKIIKSLSKYCDYTYGLTGTPMDKSPIDLWSQFNIVDEGETLGNNITIFRESFFDIKENYWGGYDYKFKKELEKLLQERIGNKSIAYGEEEVNDLSPRIEQDLKIIMTSENRKYYDDIIKGFIESKGDRNEIKNSYHKLRMVCSGFIGFMNEDNDKITMKLPFNPKLEQLLEIIDNISKNKKLLVFSQYINSNNLVCEGLEKNKIKFHQLYGKTKNKIEVIKKFKTDDSRVLSLNIESGKETLNLQAANYNIYYDLPLSYSDFRQSKKRSHRTGQEKAVFIYKLIMKNTIEEKTVEYLMKGASLYSALLEGKEKLK